MSSPSILKARGVKHYDLSPETLGAVVKAGLRALCPQLEIPECSLVEFYRDSAEGDAPEVISATVTVSVEEAHIPLVLPGMQKAA